MRKIIKAAKTEGAERVYQIIDRLLSENGDNEHEIFDYFLSKLQSKDSIEILKEYAKMSHIDLDGVIFDERSINSSSSFDQMRTNAAQARRVLKTFDPEKVKYVQKCIDNIDREIAEYFEKEDDDVTLINTQAIKTDWLIGAIEDDLMTEDEFNEIFEWLDAIALEKAHSQA